MDKEFLQNVTRDNVWQGIDKSLCQLVQDNQDILLRATKEATLVAQWETIFFCYEVEQLGLKTIRPSLPGGIYASLLLYTFHMLNLGIYGFYLFFILLQVGDWLVFENVGAYSVSLSATFNGFKRTPIRRLMQKKIWESLMNGSF